MARPRRRIKFKPFRMGEKSRNAILVGLGVFLMAIFAVPFQGSCERHRPGGRGPNDVFMTFAGKRILYGDVLETRRLCHLIFRMQLTDEQAALRLAEYQESQRAGIRVSDSEVIDAIHTQIFPRRLKVEYAIAEASALGKDIAVPEADVEAAYARDKDKRFRNADGTFRPLSEVRDALVSELRTQRGDPLAKAAVEGLKKAADALVGAPLENALKRLAPEHQARFGETRVFTARTAKSELRSIGDVPAIAERVFTDPIGRLSEPARIAGGWCIFRVVSRTRGYDANGVFHPEEEGWVRQGYGVINIKDRDELLREMGVTQAELEETLRQDLALVVLPSLVVGAVADIPRTLLEARYRRDNTQAIAAYFAMRAGDFTQGIRPTEDELRDFYARHKDVPRTEGRPGYRQPERVSLEYVLGRSSDIAAGLADDELRKYYERNTAFFGPSFEKAREDARKRLADEKLQSTITRLANRAADAAASGRAVDLKALCAQETKPFPNAFSVASTPLFAATEADFAVPELRGAKLAEMIFGERGQQYAAAGEPAKPGSHRISEVFTCETGRFFLRVLKREASQDIPYDSLSPELRQQLLRDVTNDKALVRAKEKAREYRTRIHQAAFDQFAERTGSKPLDTDFLKPKDPIPSLGQPVPAISDVLAAGEIGDLSDVLTVGDRYVLARLVAREEAKGVRFQILSVPQQGLQPTYAPSLYEQRAAYDAAPHSYLDPPKPIPFDQVKGDITKLLARRRAMDIATERIEKALAELAGAGQPDLAAAAAKHGLQVRRDVAVALDKPEATLEIGRAAGFADAIAALKPGDVSRVVSSADGRFLFVVKKRDAKAATLDVAAALFDTLMGEAKVEEKDALQYYNDHRDVAYVTGDEIKDAPAWEAAPATARDRVRAKLQEQWAKQPLADRLAALRDSLVREAFRTVPAAHPIAAARDLPLRVETIGPFPRSRPEGPLADEPAALAAIGALKPGEVTKPLTTRDGALIALLAERRPGGVARARVAIFRASDFLQDVLEPDAAAIERHYAAHKAAFRVPEQATVEFLFAATAPRQSAIQAALTDAECRRYFEERADHEYRGMSYEETEYRVRVDMARERAEREARGAADRALEAVKKSPKPAEADLAALAKQFGLDHGTSEAFAIEDPATVTTLGRVRRIADDLREAQPGHVVPRVVEGANGFAVCRLATRTAARDPELAEVRARVAQAIKLEAARAAARKAAEAFRAAAAASSFDKAVQQASPAPKTVDSERLDALRFTLPGEDAPAALTDAIFALEKPGLTPVVAADEAARVFVALVTEREPEELLTVEATAIRHWQLGPPVQEEPAEEELKKHYEANKETFRVPELVRIEYLAADYADLAKSLTASDDELHKEYDRSVAAREATYRDWSALAQPAFRPFENVKDLVQRRVLRAKAQAQADKLLAQALQALRAAGAAADLKGYAAQNAPLVAAQSDAFDREKKGLEHIGPAPELAKQAFAAKPGDLVGPVAGEDGACLFRVTERKPAEIPAFDAIRTQVEMDWERHQAVQRALAAAGKLHERIAAAMGKAAGDPRAAFRKAVEDEPFTVDVARPVTAVLSRPFYPPDAGWGKSSAITGLGEKEELVRAIFRLSPARLTPVVEDPNGSACYVGMLSQFLTPGEPGDTDLMMTQYRLSETTRRMAAGSWQLYLERQLERE